MDFGKAFTFVFDDPEWVRKVGISALISLIPIVGQFYVLGWGLEVARRLATGGAELLPDIDFGTYLGYGFKAFVVGLVWTAPIWVVSILLGIISSVAYNTDLNIANAVATIIGICGGLFGLVFGILVGIVLPAAFTRMVVFGSIKDGLAFGAVWDLVRTAPGPYLLVLVGNIVAGIVAGIVGTIACGIGVFITTTIYQAVVGHLTGQAYVAASSRT